MAVAVDYKTTLEALREIATVLSRKEEPSKELWAKAETKPGTRLKEINSKIAEFKKKVSVQTKEATKAEMVEEEDEPQKKQRDRNRDDRQSGRDKKSLNAAMLRGEHDLEQDRLYYNTAGDLRVVH